ncbi:MAG: coproporphyrinogen-III oxidase family protein, partial [Limisphaerales bacterium]
MLSEIVPVFAASNPDSFTLPLKTGVGNYFISNYPPFSRWSAEAIPHLRDALNWEKPDGPLALYVHLPFCRQRCHYCYFRVYPRRGEDETNIYIASVLKELQMYNACPAVSKRPLRSVYFGGGSPSYLSEQQIDTLMSGLQKTKHWNSVEECTFECEPGTVSSGKLQALKRAGVTRLSMGFQTLNDQILRKNGRGTTVAQAQIAYDLARKAGFTEINIDLIAGLPGETARTFESTIQKIIKLQPDCVTIYQLELTYNSSLYRSIERGQKRSLPTWKSKQQWVRDAFAALEAAGYTIGSGYMAIRDPQNWRFVYTVEHFWHGADLVGLGETSFGHFQGVHYQNHDRYDAYTKTVAAGELPVRRAFKMRAEEKLRREVILHLKTGSLDVGYFRKKFNVDLSFHFANQFAELQRRGF